MPLLARVIKALCSCLFDSCLLVVLQTLQRNARFVCIWAYSRKRWNQQKTFYRLVDLLLFTNFLLVEISSKHVRDAYVNTIWNKTIYTVSVETVSATVCTKILNYVICHEYCDAFLISWYELYMYLLWVNCTAKLYFYYFTLYSRLNVSSLSREPEVMTRVVNIVVQPIHNIVVFKYYTYTELL